MLYTGYTRQDDPMVRLVAKHALWLVCWTPVGIDREYTLHGLGLGLGLGLALGLGLGFGLGLGLGF